ncbi:short-chain dehydrogenase [Stutzerimonas stutzeri]|uniref:Short-chain dehydrogenase n=1 Tax=Stutzerimonas stutzeri TaxID=316 RepID=W8RVJ5_STUST|nr:SDR family oxidoreductase [Stutzerimonas stutzeri]AHL76081.1 short-chain dehydrogenase [Stutzerimonas stutzeri]MCQ4330567.1 SDR family oxidoreductase [Stutzerimonas stutzeri]
MTTQSVLIIGASRGLGLGLANAFAAQGWSVTATVRSQGAEALHSVPHVEIETLDITDGGSVDALAGRLSGRQFDVVFVNAGISGPRVDRASAASDSDVAALFITNSVAPVRLAERLLDNVKPGGVLTFMSSIMGSVETGSGMGMPLYGASKAALNHLVNSFAKALENGPTVLLMHPGWVRTEMGGDQAPLDVETSCRGMVQQVIHAIGQGGHRYLDYEGNELPW